MECFLPPFWFEYWTQISFKGHFTISKTNSRTFYLWSGWRKCKCDEVASNEFVFNSHNPFSFGSISIRRNSLSRFSLQLNSFNWNYQEDESFRRKKLHSIYYSRNSKSFVVNYTTFQLLSFIVHSYRHKGRFCWHTRDNMMYMNSLFMWIMERQDNGIYLNQIINT